jgi:hypothetical protein
MKLYYYLVYLFYKGNVKMTPNAPMSGAYSNWRKATNALLVLEVWVIFIVIFIVFDKYIRKYSFHLNATQILTISGVLLALHLYVFKNKKIWIKKFLKFDKLPYILNRYLGITILCLLITGLILSFVYIFIYWINVD